MASFAFKIRQMFGSTFPPKADSHSCFNFLCLNYEVKLIRDWEEDKWKQDESVTNILNGKTSQVAWGASNKRRFRSFPTSISFSLLKNSKDVKESFMFFLRKVQRVTQLLNPQKPLFSIRFAFQTRLVLFRSLKPKSQSKFHPQSRLFLVVVHFEY